MCYMYVLHVCDSVGIPHLIVLDENLKVISENGRAMVEKDPEAKV